MDEAHRLGFVHEVLEPDTLMPRAVEIAEMIGANAPLAVQGTKAVGQLPRERFGPDQLLLWLEDTQLRNERARRSHERRRSARCEGRMGPSTLNPSL